MPPFQVQDSRLTYRYANLLSLHSRHVLGVVSYMADSNYIPTISWWEIHISLDWETVVFKWFFCSHASSLLRFENFLHIWGAEVILSTLFIVQRVRPARIIKYLFIISDALFYHPESMRPKSFAAQFLPWDRNRYFPLWCERSMQRVGIADLIHLSGVWYCCHISRGVGFFVSVAESNIIVKDCEISTLRSLQAKMGRDGPLWKVVDS